MHFLLSRLEPVITEPVCHAQGYICKHERPRIRFSLTFAKVKICSNLRIRSDEGQHLDGVSPDSMLIPGLTGCKLHCHDNYGGGVHSVSHSIPRMPNSRADMRQGSQDELRNKARASGLSKTKWILPEKYQKPMMHKPTILISQTVSFH